MSRRRRLYVGVNGAENTWLAEETSAKGLAEVGSGI